MGNSQLCFDLDLQGGSDKQTALHLAGRAEHSKIVRKLIEGGANLFVRNAKSRTPKQSSKRNTGIYKLLARAEARTLKSHMEYTSIFALKERDYDNTLMIDKPLSSLIKHSEVMFKSNQFINDTAKQSNQSAIEDSFRWERHLSMMQNELKSKNSCLSLTTLKDKILNNKLKLYERYNALNTLKRRNNLQAFSDVLSSALAVSNHGLQQDIIQLTSTMMFTGVIKVLENLLDACTNQETSKLLIETLEKVKLNVLENIKHNRNSNKRVTSLPSINSSHNISKVLNKYKG
eukprot:TRINITY_DN14622_c0_g2_i1.p1 TRINITY_DN14622_c0_g2~~TRINITY_DN14622_c0_g2_i1.p1  ORF type:complete len:331 (-),score=56.30 TRINITY_DN14622_c0_g2_i1:73-939(-)